MSKAMETPRESQMPPKLKRKQTPAYKGLFKLKPKRIEQGKEHPVYMKYFLLMRCPGLVKNQVSLLVNVPVS